MVLMLLLTDKWDVGGDDACADRSEGFEVKRAVDVEAEEREHRGKPLLSDDFSTLLCARDEMATAFMQFKVMY